VKPLTAVEIAPEKPGDLKYRDKRLMVMFFDMTSMPIQDQMRAQDGGAEIPEDADDHVRPDGDHDLRQRHQGGGRLHRRPRSADSGHQEADDRRRPWA
jgi:hypothetical protein